MWGAAGKPEGVVLLFEPKAIRWLLYYGSLVQVLEPACLMKLVAEEHRRTVRIYERNS